jgi:hypothetical protein
MTQPTIAIRLGDEFDDTLRAAVRAALVELGAIQREASWGIGGSQEVETLEVAVGGEHVTIEAETYAGLTISGAEAAVRRVAERIRAMQVRGKSAQI